MKRIVINQKEFEKIRDDRAGDYSECCPEFYEHTPYPIGLTSEHWVDADGNPAGGCSFGPGFTISWQNGPPGRGEDRKEPNGAFVENIIIAVLDRMKFYQDSKFACERNENTIYYLIKALESQQSRTQDREERKVEGTHAE